MNRIRSFILVSNLIVISTGHAAAVLPLHRFNDGERGGWTAGQDFVAPSIQPTGGPDGIDDPFLIISAEGGNGPGSIIATFNDLPDWTGDFKTPGITGLSLDMMNPENSNSLSMRLALFGPNSTNNRWTSAEPILVSNDGSWNNYFFPISESALTRVLGDASFDDMISGTVRFMIRHDPGPPSAGGASIRAQLGIDNIALVDKLFGDYNNNGVLDAGDLDVQSTAIMMNDTAFDLDSDGDTDIDDRVRWIHGVQNSWVGDSNFDGEFNSSDFIAVFEVGKYETAQEATYAEGDWNGNKLVESGDFVAAFSDGGFEKGPQMTLSVPEPPTISLWTVGLLGGLAMFRSRYS